MLLLTLKALNDKAPVSIQDLLTPYQPNRSLHSSTKHELEIPKSLLKTYGDRSFSCCTPKLWNKLPLDLKECKSTDAFKKALKTLLFKRAFRDYL